MLLLPIKLAMRRATAMLKRPDSDAGDKLAYTRKEAAIRLSISERSCWSLTNSGELRSFNIGRSVRISHAALCEYIDAQETKCKDAR